MLKELQIKNFALIDDITVFFGKGLNILSGETGAGKTLIIEAINLLLGERADSELIRENEEKLMVQGYFNLNGSEKSRQFLIDSGFSSEKDNFEDIVITREVSGQGKNRAFINGIFTQVSTLKKFGRCFLDLHGQHDHQYLLEPGTHLDLVDSFGKDIIHPIKHQYQETFKKYNDSARELERLKKLQKERDSKLEELSYSYGEISKLNLQPGEEDILENERNVLKNYEKIYNLCTGTIDMLNSAEDGRDSFTDTFAALQKNIHELANIDKNYEKFLNDLDSLSVILSELNKYITDYTENLHFSSEKLDSIQERLFAISEIKRKYNMDVSHLLQYLEKIAKEMEGFKSLEEEIKERSIQFEKLKEELAQKAFDLSLKRKESIDVLEKLVKAELSSLNFKSAVFNAGSSWFNGEGLSDGFIDIEGKKIKVTANGIDDIEFLISLNPGESKKPLVKVVSGGEISRIMLALKSIVSGMDNIISMVFDEIDTGIGGNTAIVVGKKLHSISGRCQVICITHLPQIAAFADRHFYIDKVFEGGRTKIKIKCLEDESKIRELSRMLSGMSASDISLKHAGELIEKINKIKKTAEMEGN